MNPAVTTDSQPAGIDHPVVTREQWLEQRRALLAKEKALTRQHDALAQERLALPWVRVEKDYRFATPTGEVSLGDLFAGRSQLIVYHFMFGPEWTDGCVGCSFLADHFAGPLVHLNQHDVSLVVASRATLPQIEAFKQRMGWTFPWVSSHGSDFNFDFQASFRPEEKAAGRAYYNFEEGPYQFDELSGTSVFYRDASGAVYHTYSCYARGGEPFIATYAFLDIAPKGRNETGPQHNLTDWVRHHDRYGAAGQVDHTGRFVPAANSGECCHQAKGQA